jgi:hypothetical protein
MSISKPWHIGLWLAINDKKYTFFRQFFEYVFPPFILCTTGPNDGKTHTFWTKTAQSILSNALKPNKKNLLQKACKTRPFHLSLSKQKAPVLLFFMLCWIHFKIQISISPSHFHYQNSLSYSSHSIFAWFLQTSLSTNQPPPKAQPRIFNGFKSNPPICFKTHPAGNFSFIPFPNP